MTINPLTPNETIAQAQGELKAYVKTLDPLDAFALLTFVETMLAGFESMPDNDMRWKLLDYLSVVVPAAIVLGESVKGDKEAQDRSTAELEKLLAAQNVAAAAA